ncbi:related to transcriptional regulator [Melanopsichium pennsylvanicum]|uniref:Related to transcriptional regulator n=2 Tax=Melanopsichium pennsylvanicum TaxID=63383 RepID=A0AAJ4XGD8_9BASI|nr:transcriptional protein [Melanopsichium pennsylvanicum 4]SNX81535.1 related to transcriptional regulator [Melanopsichium pennsylvanicum]
MYLRPETVVSDWTEVERFLEALPLGLLTTAIPLAGQPTIQASHLPLLFTPPSRAPATVAEVSQTPISSTSTSFSGTWNSNPNSSTNFDLGILRCHLSRGNPQAKALLSQAEQTCTENEEVLAVFSDPTNIAGYISPQWYKATKPDTGKVVPTWNYTELQLYGHPTIVSPSQIVRDLSDKHEQLYANKVNKQEKWKVEHAPREYTDLLERAIIGLEIKINRVGFKCKMSTEKAEGDRTGVIEGLRDLGGEAAIMGDLVEKRASTKQA